MLPIHHGVVRCLDEVPHSGEAFECDIRRNQPCPIDLYVMLLGQTYPNVSLSQMTIFETKRSEDVPIRVSYVRDR